MNDIELLQILFIPIGKKKRWKRKGESQSKEEEREGNRRSKKETSKSFFYGQSSKIILTFCRVLYKLDRATRRLAC